MDATKKSDEGKGRWPEAEAMVRELAAALGDHLTSVVLYGSAARGDFRPGKSDLNLVVVADDLAPAVLEALSGPITRWVRKKQPPPRLLTPRIVAEAVDVYPIEFLDIRTHHVVLHGTDPFEGLAIRSAHLRMQLERELREKLMRLREGYVEAHGARPALARLLTASYTTFTALFRAGLHLIGATPPAASGEVAAAFCARAGLDPAPFEAIDQLRRGAPPATLDLKDVFRRYYEQLTRAVGAIDAFRTVEGGEIR